MGATCIVQPLDLIKNRMQVSKPGQFSSSFACGASIIKNEGMQKLLKKFIKILKLKTPFFENMFLFQQFTQVYQQVS